MDSKFESIYVNAQVTIHSQMMNYVVPYLHMMEQIVTCQIIVNIFGASTGDW